MNNEQAFEEELSALFDSLAEEQRRCPTTDELLGLAGGTLEPERRVEIERHIQLCPECTDLLAVARQPPAEIDDFTWHQVAERLDRRILPAVAAPTRTSRQPIWLALAAGVVLAVGGGLWWQARQSSAPPPAEVRGSEISIVAPIGAIDRLERLSWTAPLPIALVYTVTLEQDGAVTWQGETSSTTVELPEDLTRTLDGAYRWRVEARSATATANAPLASSPWVDTWLSAGAAPDYKGDPGQ